jgi:uncharacterized protein (DUF433 family)
MSTTVETPTQPQLQSHIRFDGQGRPWIDDTNVKVIEVVMDRLCGLTPEDICDAYPGSFTLAQVHSAVAYSYDHQAEFDAEIKRQWEEIDRLRAESLNSPGRQRLRALGKLS